MFKSTTTRMHIKCIRRQIAVNHKGYVLRADPSGHYARGDQHAVDGREGVGVVGLTKDSGEDGVFEKGTRP